MSETMQIRRALDYSPGDLVQLTGHKHAGKVGVIDIIKLSHNEQYFIYCVMLMDNGEPYFVTTLGHQMKLLRHAEE